MAAIKLIKPSHPDSHQQAPSPIVCFLPFTYRDTYNNKKTFPDVSITEKSLSIEEPIVVVNDAVKITIMNSKANAIDTAEILLMSGDINYSAAIAPGDHALIWLVNNQEDYEKVSNDVKNNRVSLNGEKSGLKFIGKVNSVRQILQTQGTDGKKFYKFNVTLSGFSEFQTQVYYNELLSSVINSVDKNASNVQFFAQISEQYQDLFKSIENDARLPTEELIKFFVDVFMGPGPKNNASVIDSKLVQTPNAAFLIPTELARYLGLALGEKADKSLGFQYSDILQRIFGLQSYSSNNMFPDLFPSDHNNYFKCSPLKGGTLIPPANFNNISLWSILQQFGNPALNEIYTTLKFIPNRGIMPTLVLRQLPFSTRFLANQFGPDEMTQIANLPRWKLDDNYPVSQYNLGTSDAERFNFFQVYTNSISDNDSQRAIQLQLILGNVRTDLADIIRSGPRIHSSTSDTEAAVKGKTIDSAAINEWADLIADFFANGHLKMNGTITVAGIQDPIAVGDNFQFDGKVFHIEGIQHVYEIEPTKGNKVFQTTLMLSHGYYINPSTGELNYMTEQVRERAFQADKHLPGFTDEERYINDVPISSTNDSANKPTQLRKKIETFTNDTVTSASSRLKGKYENKA